MNIQYDKPYLPDPFEKETGQAARTISRKGQALKKVDHNYTGGVKKQINRTKQLGSERLRVSAMTAILGNKEQKFDFNADAYLIRDKKQDMPLNSTGERYQLTHMNALNGTNKSSEAGKFDGGKVYKFKNIHGDRGTNAGLSS